MMYVPDRNPNPPSDRPSQRDLEDFEGHLCAGDDCFNEGTNERESDGEWYCDDCFSVLADATAHRMEDEA